MDGIGTTTGSPGAGERIDEQILDGLEAVLGALVAHAEQVARQFGVPVFFLKALHLLDCPMAMKDIGRLMHCDPSFVTSIADMMEARGLAARQPDPADRRVKRLALTPAGLELKRQIEDQVLRGAPWRRRLDDGERVCLLSILRKLAPVPAAQTARPAAGGRGQHRGEVSDLPAPRAAPGTLTGP